jgi:ATP-dependent helicase/nuclease subunit B
VETTAVWTDVLLKADLSRYRGLLPAGVPSPDFTWALHTAGLIQGLRKDLADGGYLISQVLRDHTTLLEELERWRDMAALETAYLERLGSLGLMDQYQSMIRCSENPEVPRGVERIIVAAVPDPTPLTVRALERLALKMPVLVLVHAPESLAGHFDSWGRPLAANWQQCRMTVPDADANVMLAGSPWTQSARALELIAAEAGRFGPADIAIGVPDEQVTPFLAADLVKRGLVPFDPAGKSVARHPLYQVLDAFRGLVNETTYQAFSTALRNADVLDLLAEEHKVSPRRVLEELDRFQNSRLPQTLEDIEQGLLSEVRRGDGHDFANLTKAAGFIHDRVRNFEGTEVDAALRGFLQKIYERRTVNPRHPDGADFIAVAQSIDTTLRQLNSDPVLALGLDKRQTLELLLSSLENQRYYPEPEDAVIDLEGWLELPWNDAPFLIVTGMNDGSVPATRLSDVFLPDSLRRELGLRHDADRLARDAY